MQDMGPRSVRQNVEQRILYSNLEFECDASGVSQHNNSAWEKKALESLAVQLIQQHGVRA